MTDRDKFAAAALTGLLAAPTDKDRSWEYWARLSYEAADAMLARRQCVTESMPVVVSGSGSVTPVPYVKHDEKRVGWHTAGETNHDAAPAAKARTDADRNRTDKAALRPGEGTGNTPEPVAWAVVYPNNEVAVIAFKRQDAEERASASDRIVPLYRQPQSALTDAEREAVATAMEQIRCGSELGELNRETATILRLLLERTK